MLTKQRQPDAHADVAARAADYEARYADLPPALIVEIAARTHEPHRVAFYLYELASDFHALWNRGNDAASLRFVQEGDAEATSAKIPLARAVHVVISAGLGILGVTPAEEMR